MTGEQGVIMPYQNIRNLVLREDVVEAVQKGQFHIYAVKTIDEGIGILTGVAAGEKREDGSFAEGTANYSVDRRLRELARGAKEHFGQMPEAF
jgi:predicted ATP-dependent protease